MVIRQEGRKTFVNTSVYGFPSEYEEAPFEWEEGRRFSITRRMLAGPISRLEMVFLLEDADRGTKVSLQLTLLASSALLSPVAKVAAKRALSKIVKALEHVDAGDWSRTQATRPVDPALVQRYVDALSAQHQGPLGPRLVKHVSTAHESELNPIRPFVLADTWSADRRELLELCLHAALAGLLELRWDLVCPSCRTTSESVSQLEQVDGSGHCDLCDISFELDLDQSVEAVFVPAPALRKLSLTTYCTGGPARTPHVVGQANVSDGVATLPAPKAKGRYRLFLRGGSKALVEIDEGGERELVFEHDAQAKTLAPTQATLHPEGQLVVRSTVPDAHAKIERLEWASRAATAHTVATLPTFRRQFSQQILRPGLSLRVGRVALLFSDLTGSTAMYSRLGDAMAFSLVQDHFDLLSGIIDEHDGAIIKTIGDAVMAVFVDESPAVKAALSMLRAFDSFAEEHENGEGLTLKLGVYAGACYAVTANDQLDYFGQTVNVAARLQGQAGAAELILTQELAKTAEENGWIGNAVVTERYAAKLKGIEGAVDVVRLKVQPT